MQAQLTRARGVGLMVMVLAMLGAGAALAAPYAAMVMDARNGAIIHARNHDTKLHPASLTKMMTLYVAFEAVKHGEVGLDTRFTTSRRATRQECVCLGLKRGQQISLRYLIRAAALRSANDAAVVIAEGISGSVEAFARRMTRTARAMGMANTTFRNPNGLTQPGHVSTARDMTILGRQLFHDYPQYFNIFSRRSDHAGIATVPNTNRRFLNAYDGANGIKTGYTRAAGFNLTASAQRGPKHIIATMFGGSSTAARNRRVAELLDMGFSRADRQVAVRKPATPAYQGTSQLANGDDDPSAGAKTIRVITAVKQSPRPRPRPASDALPEDMLVAMAEQVDTAIVDTATEMALAALAPESLPLTPPPRPGPATAAGPDAAPAPTAQALAAAAVDSAVAAVAQPDNTPPEPAPAGATPTADTDGTGDRLWTGAARSFLPGPQPRALSLNADLDLSRTAAPRPTPDSPAIILTRGPDPADADAAGDPGQTVTLSSSDAARDWAVALGGFNTRHAAERSLITVKMAEAPTLGAGVSRIRQSSGQFNATIRGLTRTEARNACLRLAARDMDCAVRGP